MSDRRGSSFTRESTIGNIVCKQTVLQTQEARGERRQRRVRQGPICLTITFPTILEYIAAGTLFLDLSSDFALFRPYPCGLTCAPIA